MTPVLLLLLFLSLTAIPPGATTDGFLDTSEIIERANADIATSLTYGDIVPNKNRNADPCTARGCKWPKSGSHVIVPVVISSRYSRNEQMVIIKSLLTFQWFTCIRFVWKGPRHKHYLYFFPGTGCWSHLGRQSRGQAISLKKKGCLYTRTVQHEVFHALGFHHEQVRSDRDRYVSILSQNIKPGKESNFRKVQTNNLGTPYDFNSVMHYSNYAFSKNRKQTIIARKNPHMSFGQARFMSANDIARINKLYQC
ncbi:high choriolytic enzyme 2-like [Xiphias gladius]|uniref:high choriolytic enzyme 2-like n=1 Tax=Xiphias gladius TaxID=8245 RepID=UPI001A9824D4|nr:high choriolytic enzyme 2-like [Xiphias gladius]